MRVGYARTSTVEQQAGFEAQLKELEAAGCTKFFNEQVSAVKQRNELEKAIDFVRDGDVFIVTKLDRLARSVPDLHRIVGVLKAKNVSLLILNMGIDTSTETGNLMLTIMAGVAQFEREIMLERQKEGIARAKLLGKYKGKVSGRQVIPVAIECQVNTYLDTNVSKVWIADKLGISQATVYRIAKKKRALAG